MTFLVVLLVGCAAMLAVAYVIERIDHRQRTGRVGWTCEAVRCSCRGSRPFGKGW